MISKFSVPFCLSGKIKVPGDYYILMLCSQAIS